MTRRTALLLAAGILALPAALDAQTLDLPPRRAGLWEVVTVVEKPKSVPAVPGQMCLDPATDREVMEHLLKLSGSCRSLNSRREGGALVIEADCSIGDKAARTKATISGDLKSAYTARVEVTMDRGPDKPPRVLVTTETGTWKSADCPGMKPGDVTMFGGVKVNIKQLKALSGLIR